MGEVAADDGLVTEGPGPGRADPLVAEAERIAGVVTALGALLLLVTYVAVPVQNLGPFSNSPLVDALPLFSDAGVALPCALMTALGLAVVLRPALGPGVVAAAAVPLAGLFALVGALGDANRDAPPGSGTLGPALPLLQGAGALLVLGVALALVALGVRLRPRGLVLAPTDAAAVAVAGAGLWLSVGADWYEVSWGGPTDRLGSLLDWHSSAGRGAWLGFGLAAVAVLAATVAGGAGRRVVGAVVAALLVFEAVRRVLVSPATLAGGGGGSVPFAAEARILVPVILLYLVGALGGAWLVTTPGPGPDDEAGLSEPVLPGDPPDHWPVPG